MKKTVGSSNYGALLKYGANSNNWIYINRRGMSRYNNGNYYNINENDNWISNDVEFTVKYTYVNGVHTYYVNDVQKATFSYTYTNRDWNQIGGNGTYIKNIKIKQL